MEKVKKKRTNPGKGSNFERSVSKKLSLWLSGGEDDSWVWRTSSSGARAKTRAKQGKATSNSSGDLKAENPKAFVIFENCSWELKNGYGTYCLLDLIDKKSKNPKQVEKFFLQAKEDCKNANVKYPILVLKRDRCCEIVGIPTELFSFLWKQGSKPSQCERIQVRGSSIMCPMTFLALDNFLSWCRPSFFEGSENE